MILRIIKIGKIIGDKITVNKEAITALTKQRITPTIAISMILNTPITINPNPPSAKIGFRKSNNSIKI